VHRQFLIAGICLANCLANCLESTYLHVSNLQLQDFVFDAQTSIHRVDQSHASGTQSSPLGHEDGF
jgi:hypothetical protein